jgi:outer membrane lipoprotein-sorting protein
MRRPFLLIALPLITPALITLLLGGCASHPALPPVHWDTPREAIGILQDRAHAVRTVSATGLLTLTRPNGESVRFDAALVSQPPHRLRLRAWKFGRAVFDLTLTPDGLWMLTPDDPSMKQKVKSAGISAAELARMWSQLSGEFFDRSDLQISVAARRLTLTAPFEDMQVVCRIDSRTLVPLSYMLTDARNMPRFTLSLSDYHLHQLPFPPYPGERVGERAGERGQPRPPTATRPTTRSELLPYPHRLTAVSDTGSIRLDLQEIELNTALADGAFVPPRRAEKIASP